jgi:hypothetical protein
MPAAASAIALGRVFAAAAKRKSSGFAIFVIPPRLPRISSIFPSDRAWRECGD